MKHSQSHYGASFPYKKLLFLTIIFYSISCAFAADDASGGQSIPKFNATRIKYNGWYTEFMGWLAMKYPDLIDLVEGDWEEPDEDEEE